MKRIGIALPMMGTAMLLSGCVSPQAAPRPVATAPAAPQEKPIHLMGANAKQLIAQFGQPRLDIRERTVRKLQFRNDRCVLDAYLYTTAKGKEAVVTFVDARLPDGRDTEQNGCARTLLTRR
ncbi:MAG: hypothetical protein DI547_08180 [Sphingobium sp.]|nr:MAG: hypothetical protein DI547_08180 [Sphingobium sp.]